MMETHCISDLPTLVLSYHIPRQPQLLKQTSNNSVAARLNKEGVPDSGLKYGGGRPDGAAI